MNSNNTVYEILDLTEASFHDVNERDQWENMFLKERADFINYKKRVDKQQALWKNNTQKALLADILEIVDDFERALDQQKQAEDSSELQVKFAGFTLISKELYKFLNKYGVKEITNNVIFDPLYHEALVQVDSPDHHSGVIVDVMQKGYMFKDEVLRPAKVSVAR